MLNNVDIYLILEKSCGDIFLILEVNWITCLLGSLVIGAIFSNQTNRTCQKIRSILLYYTFHEGLPLTLGMNNHPRCRLESGLIYGADIAILSPCPQVLGHREWENGEKAIWWAFFYIIILLLLDQDFTLITLLRFNQVP